MWLRVVVLIAIWGMADSAFDFGILDGPSTPQKKQQDSNRDFCQTQLKEEIVDMVGRSWGDWNLEPPLCPPPPVLERKPDRVILDPGAAAISDAIASKLHSTWMDRHSSRDNMDWTALWSTYVNPNEHVLKTLLDSFLVPLVPLRFMAGGASGSAFLTTMDGKWIIKSMKRTISTHERSIFKDPVYQAEYISHMLRGSGDDLVQTLLPRYLMEVSVKPVPGSKITDENWVVFGNVAPLADRTLPRLSYDFKLIETDKIAEFIYKERICGPLGNSAGYVANIVKQDSRFLYNLARAKFQLIDMSFLVMRVENLDPALLSKIPPHFTVHHTVRHEDGQTSTYFFGIIDLLTNRNILRVVEGFSKTKARRKLFNKFEEPLFQFRLLGSTIKSQFLPPVVKAMITSKSSHDHKPKHDLLEKYFACRLHGK